MEEVEDEDDVSVTTTKKKKKKKKPKKKSTNGTAAGERPLTPVLEIASPVTPTKPSAASPSPAPSSPALFSPAPATPSPKKKSAAKPPPSRSSSINDSTTTLPHMSTASLPLPPLEQTAQSARSYLQSENLIESKNKIKSRPNYTTSLASTSDGKGGLMSRLGVMKKSTDEDEEKKPKTKFFARMTKKTTSLMHQLIGSSSDVKKGQAPMKWESFLKVRVLFRGPSLIR